jgi:hypothetical protein
VEEVQVRCYVSRGVHFDTPERALDHDISHLDLRLKDDMREALYPSGRTSRTEAIAKAHQAIDKVFGELRRARKILSEIEKLDAKR